MCSHRAELQLAPRCRILVDARAEAPPPGHLDQETGDVVSLVRPYYYWREVRTDTTSNSQFPSVAPKVAEVQAQRRDDDEYIRSVWSAQVSYSSDGTNTTYGWWAQAAVRLVVGWHLLDPSDVGDDDPLTLGFTELFPERFALDADPHYAVVWSPKPSNLYLQTARLGLGESVLPSVLGSLWYYSQYGGWGSFEATGIKRLRITGRVLWASKDPS
jgi:hypothetical protein